jgi:hypothetical protein
MKMIVVALVVTITSFVSFVGTTSSANAQAVQVCEENYRGNYDSYSNCYNHRNLAPPQSYEQFLHHERQREERLYGGQQRQHDRREYREHNRDYGYAYPEPRYHYDRQPHRRHHQQNDDNLGEIFGAVVGGIIVGNVLNQLLQPQCNEVPVLEQGTNLLLGTTIICR